MLDRESILSFSFSFENWYSIRMSKELQTAMEAAKAGAEVLSQYFEGVFTRRTKEDTSLVTQADVEAERAIVKRIRASFPDHQILGEEGGSYAGEPSVTWHIDPLDGTMNFANSIPIFAVSVALVKDGMVTVGVVCNPATNTLFSAERGKGAFVSGSPMRVSDQDASQAMVTAGSSKTEGDRRSEDAFGAAMRSRTKYRRRLGSCALELAFVARGGTEGFACFGLNTWDYAAGTLLVEEAGGRITDFAGNPWKFPDPHFIASNGVMHEALLEAVAGLEG
ncbi:MAG: inositol monophosphatase family protein [Candidatus Pacearchaeota archaeon]|nr:inositol monophosphatase family protein [Candidatus Pacearchaeota archaeon]